MFNDLGQPWGAILLVAASLVIYGVLGFFVLKWYRWYQKAAARAQIRAFEGVTISQSPAPGLVEVVFHTYFGILVFTHQVEYQFWASPEDARLVLARLNWFNLKWGFFAFGALFIPLLSLGNYWGQLSRINKQAARPT